MSVTKNIKGTKNIPTDTLIPNRVVILVPRIFARTSAAMKTAKRMSIFTLLFIIWVKFDVFLKIIIGENGGFIVIF